MDSGLQDQTRPSFPILPASICLRREKARFRIVQPVTGPAPGRARVVTDALRVDARRDGADMPGRALVLDSPGILGDGLRPCATLAPLLRLLARYCKLITPISAARFAGFTGSVHRTIETAPKQTGRAGGARACALVD